jgi:hypothetical protein
MLRAAKKRLLKKKAARITAGGCLFAVALFMLPLFPPFSLVYSAALAAIAIVAILTVAGAIVGLAVL